MRDYILILMYLFVVTRYSISQTNKNIYPLIKIDLYLEMKKYKEAFQEIKNIDFNKIKNDERPYVFNKVGFIYYKINEYNKALEFYFKALEYNPKIPYIYNNIGAIYYALKKYKEAKKYYLKALSIMSNYAKVLVNLAVVDFYLKNYNESYNWFKKALKCDKDYVKKRFKKKKAMDKLKELIKEHPEDKELKRILKWAQKYQNKDIYELKLFF